MTGSAFMFHAVAVHTDKLRAGLDWTEMSCAGKNGWEKRQ